MIAVLAAIGGMALAACQWLIYVYAPVEASLGIPQKIFYMHLPLAWWALFSFFLVFAGSIAWLWRRKPVMDSLCQAAAELGLLFSGLALLSGMIWAKISWGVWWTWDPRLSTTLVMWFIYAAYALLRHMDMPLERRRVICAVMGIVAFLDVPLVFVSARIFRSIHPAVFAKGGGLDSEMQLAALCCVTGLGIYWLALLLLRWRQICQQDRLDILRWRFLGAGLRRDEDFEASSCRKDGEKAGN